MKKIVFGLMFGLMTILGIYITFLIFTNREFSTLPVWRKIGLYLSVELPYFTVIYLIITKKIKI
jgi:hypothetical protein